MFAEDRTSLGTYLSIDTVPPSLLSIMSQPAAVSVQIGLSDQGPVVQRVVSLTISLRHKFVKQISAKVINTLLFFVEEI